VSLSSQQRWPEAADPRQRDQGLRATPPLVLFGSPAEERAAALYLLYPRVCELHERYAQLQGRLRAAWWERDAEIELLAALCAQRALLDARALQPESASEQIDFLLALPLIAEQLTQSSGSGAFDPQRDRARFLAWLEAASREPDAPHATC
jgi:hypothetical protein